MVSERTEYTLPGEHIWLGTDGLWYGDGEHGKTLADQLDAMERSYKERAEECAEGLAAVRLIRVEAGLGVLEWVQPCDGVWSAVAAGGLFKYGIDERSDGRFVATVVVGPEDRRMCCSSIAAAKAACEQWYADWLERAGLEVKP